MSHEAISNEIFQHFRSEQKKIDNAKTIAVFISILNRLNMIPIK